MKQYIALLICLVLCAGLLVACAEKIPSADTEPDTKAATEPATAPATESGIVSDTDPDTDPVTDPVTDSDTETEPEPETDPATESDPATAPATETEPVTEPVTETEPETEPPYPALDPATLTAEKTYDNDHGSLLSAYSGKTVEDYEGVCYHYEKNGWTLYCENEIGGNLFSTYTKDAALAHVYWIDAQKELNIVTSETEGASLPPRDEAYEGTLPTTVTQLQQNPSETSGMAYIIRLSDGSFIIYDGAYSTTVKQVVSELHALHGDGEVHIRAWIMSHSHDDHYSCFQALARRLKKNLEDYDMTLKLDYFIMAPMSDEDALALDEDGKFFISGLDSCLEKFEGAQICYAHTGMTFRFANMTLEILHSAEDLFIDGSTGYFNDSSLVTRLYSHEPDTEETLSMIFLGDAGVGVAERLMQYYGDELRSDMCQISHHGVENFPLEAYQMIAAPTLFYPCNNWLYALTDRDADVRAALREWDVTKEILLRDNDKYTRYFDPSLNPAPIGKPNASGVFETEPEA